MAAEYDAWIMLGAEEELAAESGESSTVLTREPRADEKFLRHGDIPEGGRSYNHRDHQYEAGVSVYGLTKKGRSWKLETGYGFAIFAEKPCYVVTGKVLVEEDGNDRTGSDGEPLLVDVRIISKSRRQPTSYL